MAKSKIINILIKFKEEFKELHLQKLNNNHWYQFKFYSTQIKNELKNVSSFNEIYFDSIDDFERILDLVINDIKLLWEMKETILVSFESRQKDRKHRYLIYRLNHLIDIARHDFFDYLNGDNNDERKN